MKNWDQHKLDAIHSSVLEIVKRDGIVNLSMGKVAKMANISARTIYLHYNDKADLLEQMYLNIKRRFDSNLPEDLLTTEDLFVKFEITIKHFVNAFNKWPDEWIYMQSIQQNPQLISESVQKKIDSIAEPVSELYEDMQKDDRFKHASKEVFTSIAAGPMVMMAAQAIVSDRKITTEELELLIKATIDAIRA